MNVEIENIRIKMQLDTGSDVAIVNEETWKYVSKPKLSKSIRVAHGTVGKRLYFAGELCVM